MSSGATVSRAGLVAAAMALALIGCGSSEEAAPAGPTPVPQVVTFNTVDGGQFDLGDLNGQDSVLWFWAPW